mmetsp:Transcript_602/g.2018  ORF Transcript_602/g.2018 Transcript_602/m.2018 type:complete len:150 (-) Transcript_602:911-1360(-)
MLAQVRWRACGTARRWCSSTGSEAARGKQWLESYRREPQGGTGLDEKAAMKMDKRARSAMFRSSQRGWLELDVLLGRYAAANLRNISANEQLLEQYEKLLDSEAPDVFQWATAQSEPPAELAQIVDRIQRFTFGLEDSGSSRQQPDTSL